MEESGTVRLKGVEVEKVHGTNYLRPTIQSNRDYGKEVEV